MRGPWPWSAATAWGCSSGCRGQAWAVGADLEVGLFEALGQTPTSTSLVVPARPVGSASWSKQMGRALSPRDALESLVHFSDVVGRPAPASIHNEWARATKRSELVATVGKGSSGNVHLDFGKEGPHALVVGGTGSGKSEFLSTMVLSLAATPPPMTCVSSSLTSREVRALITWRTCLTWSTPFQTWTGRVSHGFYAPSTKLCNDARGPWLFWARAPGVRRGRSADLRAAVEWVRLRLDPALMVVVDEFQILSEAHPDLMDRLAELAAQGRSLGFHLVLASQRPGGAITPALRSTLDLRVALRCTEKRDSVEVIGIGDAAELCAFPGVRSSDRSRSNWLWRQVWTSWVSVIGEVWEENLGRPQLAKAQIKGGYPRGSSGFC